MQSLTCRISLIAIGSPHITENRLSMNA